MNESTTDLLQTPSAADQPFFKANDHLALEDALAHASELLGCASATAYECGDSLKGPQRELAFSVLHLVQMAQALVNKSLEHVPVLR